MGIYYALVDETEKKKYHLDYHIKTGPITTNFAVQCAFVNVMFRHQGNSFSIMSDAGYPDCEYKEIDLLRSDDLSDEIYSLIVDELNKIYGDSRYKNRNTKVAT